jgi:Ca-activated chloride channel homolog
MKIPLFRLAWLMAAIFLGACTLLEAQEQPQTQEEKIQVRVDRINVGVVITDAQGRFVSDLHREQFHVLDNGVEQPAVAFAAIEEPAQVLLLIEAGPAVYMLEGSHVWAANALLEGLSAGDRVAVVKYADAPTGVLDFTTDKLSVANALDGLRFNLGFASLNLSASVSKVLEWLAHVEEKKSIVLLSTGVDTSAQNELVAALQRLGVSDVRLFAVSLANGLRNAPAKTKKKTAAPPPSNIDSELEEASKFLRQLAEASGGRAFFPSSPAEFGAAYSQIAELVRHEYSLAYALPVRDGQVHKIDVRVDGPSGSDGRASTAGYRVDHRHAYLAPAAR